MKWPANFCIFIGFLTVRSFQTSIAELPHYGQGCRTVLHKTCGRAGRVKPWPGNAWERLGTPGTWAEELQHVGKILGQMQGIHVFYILFPVAWIWKETDWRLNAGRIWRCLALSRKMIRVFLFSSAMISLVAYDLILRQSHMCGRKMLPSWPFLVDRNTSTEFQHTVVNAATAAVKKTR